MLLPVPPKFQKRRKGPKRRAEAPPTPPITGNVIIAVNHGFSGDTIVATVNGTVTAIDEPGFALQVRTGIGTWIAPTTVNFDSLPTVLFTFEVGVSSTTQ